MSLLTDSEKVELLITVLDNHIKKLPPEDGFANYLEAIRFLLKTKDPIIQKAAFSTGDILLENLAHSVLSQISLKQAVGTLISAFDKIGYSDAIDASAVILHFEEFLIQMPAEEAKRVYDERWTTDKEGPSFGDLIEYLESYLAELCLELQHDPTDQFVQGKMKGLQHSLKMARMHARM